MTSHDSYDNKALRLLLAPVLVAGLALGCAPAKSGGGGGGSSDSSSSGSSSSGGSSGGGSSSSSSSSSGGSSSGGSSSSSKSSSGGSSSGGSSSSSSSSGGSSSGGSSSGGSSSSSSSSSGGSTSSSGGSGGSGSASSGGSTASGDRPPGYFKIADWGVTKVDWQGCVWTGKDTTVSGSDTSVVPSDFTTSSSTDSYKISGSVFNDYNSVALIGFNINEAPTGKSDQCKYDPAVKDGPPTVTIPSDAKGIAINWTAAKLPLTFRIQIQGVKGSSDANQRWCATIKDASGPSFVAWEDFNTTCWDNKGKTYAKEPIDAVAFQVPGTTTAKSPYDITILGFAPGNSKADAPGKAPECGAKSGTIGSNTVLGDATKAKDASTARAAVTGKTGSDCKTYIINNNNWGQPTTTYQQLSFLGNSFKIDAANGSPSGQGVPASFPSIYVGGNGNVAGGSFDTWADTGLPKAISGITSAKSTFKWSGKSSGDFNATYDIWFAKSSPTAGSYEDGISGLLMVWLYKPGSRSPIGSVKRQANIAGKDYEVWVGPRNATAKGADDTGRPVVSYVAKGTITDFSADLKLFFDDAVKNGDADKSAGGTSQAFSNSWFLTDVFGGFELWSAGDGVGLKADEFTFILNK